MDRFSETTMTYGNVDRDEDGFPDPPAPETFDCASCGLDCLMTDLGAEIDPECTCIQTDVDQLDARGCDAHGSRYPKTVLICKGCMEPEAETAELTNQDTAETLALLAKSGCGVAAMAAWMHLIEEKVA